MVELTQCKINATEFCCIYAQDKTKASFDFLHVADSEIVLLVRSACGRKKILHRIEIL